MQIHLNYINDFGLCCPIETSNEVEKLTNISDYNIKNIFELNRDYGLLSVLKNFFPNLLSVMAACKKAEVAHSGGAGWAFPLSFYLLILGFTLLNF